MVKDILPHLFLCDGHRHGCSSVLTKRGYTTPLFYPQRPAFIFLSPIRSKREFPSISNKIGDFHTTKCNKVVPFRTHRPLFSLIAHRRTTRLSKITRFFAESHLFFSKITPFLPFLKFPIFVQLPVPWAFLDSLHKLDINRLQSAGKNGKISPRTGDTVRWTN